MTKYPNNIIRGRVLELNSAIRKGMYPCTDIRIVLRRQSKKYETYAGVPLYKKKDVSFSERTKIFKQLLENSLLPSEQIRFENKSFVIEAEDYVISYTLEGYRKNADLIGYYEDGRIVTEIPGRPGVVWAKKMVKNHFNKRTGIWGFTESENDMIWICAAWDFASKKYPDMVGQYVHGVRKVLDHIKKDSKDISHTQDYAFKLIGQQVLDIYIDKGRGYWWIDDGLWDAEDVIINTPIGLYRIGHTIDSDITIHAVEDVGADYHRVQLDNNSKFLIKKLTDVFGEGHKDALCIAGDGTFVTIFALDENVVVNCTEQDNWDIY